MGLCVGWHNGGDKVLDGDCEVTQVELVDRRKRLQLIDQSLDDQVWAAVMQFQRLDDGRNVGRQGELRLHERFCIAFQALL